MRKLLAYCMLTAGLLLAAFSTTCAECQGLGPLLQTFHKKAKGAVQASNLSDMPKTVECQARGFDVDEHGTVKFMPLDQSLHVRIAGERTELGPHGTRLVSFEATPRVSPAWFAVTCRFIPLDRGKGLTLGMEITSLVFIQGRQIDAKDVRVVAKRTGGGKKVTTEISNEGSELARVGPEEIMGHGKKEHMDSFLLFPHHKRLLETDWKNTAPAETVRLQVGKKHLQAQIN